MLIISKQVRQSSQPNKRIAITPDKVPTKAATKLPIIFWKTFDWPGVLIASWHNAAHQPPRDKRVQHGTMTESRGQAAGAGWTGRKRGEHGTI
jgi:hypothetical protein